MASKWNSRNRSASSPPFSPPAKRQKITVVPFAASFPRRTLLSSSRWVNKVPHDIWVYKISQPFLDLKGLSTVRRCNTFFEEYWQYVLKQNIIRVPEGCPTMNQAMDLAVIFSERNDCTTENPAKILVGEGKHEMVGVGVAHYGRLMHVSCSNITIIGKGKGKTTMLGGFYVNGKQNVKIEQLSATHATGYGLMCEGSGTNVDVSECCFKQCQYSGLDVHLGATVTATQCEFMETACGVYCRDANTKVRLNDCKMHHNGGDGRDGGEGLRADEHAVVDLHGSKTDIHSNKRHGIVAFYHGKVNIHLPYQHNTTHANVGDDRRKYNGGFIANINADGTVAHVPVEEVEINDY